MERITTMQYEVTSLNTKRLLAGSLRKFMREKSFSKITVSEICLDCGVNRKTFYYHFEDIYALLKWILDQEALKIFLDCGLHGHFKDTILFLLDYIDTNRQFLNSIYDSLGYDGLREFLYEDFIRLLSSIITNLEKQEGCLLEQNLRQFLCQFYAGALSGILKDFLKARHPGNHKDIQERISFTLETSLLSLIREKGKKVS